MIDLGNLNTLFVTIEFVLFMALQILQIHAQATFQRERHPMPLTLVASDRWLVCSVQLHLTGPYVQVPTLCLCQQ